MSETNLVLESVEKLLSKLCTAEVVAAAEAGTFPDALWGSIVEMGLPLLLVAEEDGGVALGWPAACAVMRLAGSHNLPLPLAETMLASWAASASGHAAPAEHAIVVSAGPNDGLRFVRDKNQWKLSGQASRVAWRRKGGLVVVADGPEGEMVAVLDSADGAKVTPGANLAGEARDTFLWTDCAVAGDAVRPAGIETMREVIFRRAAAMRSAQISGALQRVLDMSVEHALQRVQFGRPIAKFQAVQQQLAVLAVESAAAVAASSAAANAVGQEREEFLCAVAKTRTAQAVTKGAPIAHQVHGAIGFTEEFSLHHSTRRLWSWREEFGNENLWSQRVFALVAGKGPLWETIVA